MHVILDTNILYNNYRLDTEKFQALFEYLKKTKSKLLIPECVFDELVQKYHEGIERYKKENERDLRIYFGRKDETDVEKEVVKYRKELMQKLNSGGHRIFPTGEIDVRKIIERAVRKVPPFDEQGRGFRDTIIWESALGYIKKHPGTYCFVSQNVKDFGDGNLKDELLKEVSRMQKSQLYYYNSLEGFLSEWGTKIAFLTEELIENFLDKNKKYLETFIDKDDIPLTNEDFPAAFIPHTIENYNLFDINVSSYFIYKRDNNKYYVTVSVDADVEVEVIGESVVLDEPWPDSELVNERFWISVDLIFESDGKKIQFDSTKEPQISYAIF